MAPLAGGMDVRPLVDELTERVERGTGLHPGGGQPAAGRGGFRRAIRSSAYRRCWPTPRGCWSASGSTGHRSVRPRSAADRGRAQRGRADVRPVPLRRAEHGRPAARRPPSRQLPSAAGRPARRRRLRTGAKLPDGLPAAMGRILRIAQNGNADQVAAGCGPKASSPPTSTPQDLMDYLAPFVEPAPSRSSSSTASGCGSSSPGSRIPGPPAAWAGELNLPPDYLLIHRVWSGGIAVLCQLNARAAFRSRTGGVPPGYAPPTRLRPRRRDLHHQCAAQR